MGSPTETESHCDDCGPTANRVGPWRDSAGTAKLCGPCKMKRWSARGGPARLKAELESIGVSHGK